MALTLRIGAGGGSQDWTLSDRYLEDLKALRSHGETQQALEVLLGPDSVDFGKSWDVRRDELIAALRSLVGLPRSRGGRLSSESDAS
jgi:hypothetical protein